MIKAFAPLSADLIRRAAPPSEGVRAAAEPLAASAGWRDDVKLFAAAWAAGFVVFFVFLG